MIGDLAKVGIKAKLNYMQYRALRDLDVEGRDGRLHHMTWGSNSIPDASAITGVFFIRRQATIRPDDPEVKSMRRSQSGGYHGRPDPDVRKKALSRKQ